jgi:chromate transporter
MRLDVLVSLIAVFTPLSLAAVGGVSSVFASIQHQSVEVRHWVTNREFVELFAIARGAPGPGSMLVTLIGWKAAGWAGAITATLALYLPSSLLALAVSKVWGHFAGRAWHKALQAGLAPVGTGLMIAGIAAIFQAAGTGLLSWIVAAGAALAMNFFPNISPLLLLGAGGAVFLAVGGQ